ncbi:hypothetical protein Vretifemale_355 [Volvox reticuliferus]|uniref:Uncharacterized protein n=1 Tax=Volvox reticuliferus TaxID=1737510 RepID=A0A8J4C146_9CHLO|nr:hypothetical protein Vretifemale_355 [Volvox reticuliferus]
MSLLPSALLSFDGSMAAEGAVVTADLVVLAAPALERRRGMASTQGAMFFTCCGSTLLAGVTWLSSSSPWHLPRTGLLSFGVRALASPVVMQSEPASAGPIVAVNGRKACAEPTLLAEPSEATWKLNTGELCEEFSSTFPAPSMGCGSPVGDN